MYCQTTGTVGGIIKNIKNMMQSDEDECEFTIFINEINTL